MAQKILKYIASLIFMMFTGILSIWLLCDRIHYLAVIFSLIVIAVMTYAYFTDKPKMYFVSQFILPLVISLITLVLISLFGKDVIDTSGFFGSFSLMLGMLEAVFATSLSVIGIIAFVIYRAVLNNIKVKSNPEGASSKISRVSMISAIAVILVPFVVIAIVQISDYAASVQHDRDLESFHENQLYKENFYITRGYYDDSTYPESKSQTEFEYYWSIFDKYLDEVVKAKDLDLVYEWTDNEYDSFYMQIPVFVKNNENGLYEYKMAVKGWYSWNNKEYYNSQGYMIYSSPKDIESYYDLDALTVHIEEVSES